MRSRFIYWRMRSGFRSLFSDYRIRNIKATFV